MTAATTVEELRQHTGKALRKLQADNVRLCDLVTALAQVVDDQQAKLIDLEARLIDLE